MGASRWLLEQRPTWLTWRRGLRRIGAGLASVLLVLVSVQPALAQTTGEITATAAPCGTNPVADQDTFLVAVKPLEPFVFIDGESIRGFSIDYWFEVASRLNIETQWCQAHTVGEIVDLAAADRVDASIAGISITREREAIVDFSQPYYDSGHQIVARHEGSSAVGSLIGLLASGTFLWPLSILVLLVLLVSHLVWLFERGHDSDDFPTDYRHGIGEAIWWSTVSVITGGEAVKNINTALSRVIAVFWMLVGLFLLAFVTARATSVMTVAELQTAITGPNDLAGRSVTTIEGTASVEFMQNELGVSPRLTTDIETALDDLANSRTDAVIFDAPVVAYAVAQNYAGTLALVKPKLGRDPYGIALPPDSDWFEQVNAAVIEIGRDGTLDDLLDEWFGSG